jgi:hypothetical protein
VLYANQGFITLVTATTGPAVARRTSPLPLHCYAYDEAVCVHSTRISLTTRNVLAHAQDDATLSCSYHKLTSPVYGRPSPAHSFSFSCQMSLKLQGALADDSLLDAVLCSYVESDRRFRRVYCTHHKESGDGDSRHNHIWNVWQFLWDQTAQPPRRQSSAYASPLQYKISLWQVFVASFNLLKHTVRHCHITTLVNVTACSSSSEF